jgi:hypothetical protein
MSGVLKDGNKWVFGHDGVKKQVPVGGRPRKPAMIRETRKLKDRLAKIAIITAPKCMDKVRVWEGKWGNACDGVNKTYSDAITKGILRSYNRGSVNRLSMGEAMQNNTVREMRLKPELEKDLMAMPKLTRRALMKCALTRAQFVDRTPICTTIRRQTARMRAHTTRLKKRTGSMRRRFRRPRNPRNNIYGLEINNVPDDVPDGPDDEPEEINIIPRTRPPPTGVIGRHQKKASLLQKEANEYQLQKTMLRNDKTR